MSLFNEENTEGQCRYGLCACPVKENQSYCSVGCKEAAEQAVDRQYCQCGDPQCMRATSERSGLGSSTRAAAAHAA